MRPRSLVSALARTQAPDIAPGAGVRIAEGLVRRLIVQLQLNEAECAAARSELAAEIAMMRRRVLEERLRMARGVLNRAAAARDDWLCEPDPRRPATAVGLADRESAGSY
jgi:hypothetical protein